MSKRQRLSTPLIVAALVLQALILGGNLYEQWVTLPYWAEDPPRTTLYFREILETGHFNFYILTPIAIAASLLALAVAWTERSLRAPLALGAAATAGILVVTVIWAVPQLMVIFPPRQQGLPDPADAARAIRALQTLSYGRWGMLLLGFACSLRALHLSGRAAGAVSGSMIRAGSIGPAWNETAAR